MSSKNINNNNGRDMVDSDSDSEPLLQFSLPTRNKFATRQQWRDTEEEDSEWIRAKRRNPKKSLDSSVSVESFRDLSTDDKLVKIFDQLNRNYTKIQKLEANQTECMKDVRGVNKALSSTNSRVDQLEKAVKTLSYRSIDIEARSRRNNVIFYNITERTGIADKHLILQFIADELGIESGKMHVERAHRLGHVKQEVRRAGSDPKRPLIVRFRDYVDTEAVMRRAFRLKGSPFGVDRDYPREISDARKLLYTSNEAKQARYERREVQVRYPARLYIDGKLVEDAFPEWFDVMGQYRIVQHTRRRQVDSRNFRRTADDVESGEDQRPRDSTTSSPHMRHSADDVDTGEDRRPRDSTRSTPRDVNRREQRRVESTSRARNRAHSDNINSKNNRKQVTESQKVSSQVEAVREQRRRSKYNAAPREGVSPVDQSKSDNNK